MVFDIPVTVKNYQNSYFIKLRALYHIFLILLIYLYYEIKKGGSFAEKTFPVLKISIITMKHI